MTKKKVGCSLLLIKRLLSKKSSAPFTKARRMWEGKGNCGGIRWRQESSRPGRGMPQKESKAFDWGSTKGDSGKKG